MEKIVIANWKMHKTAREATDYIERLIPKLDRVRCRVFLAVPYTALHAAAQFAKGTKIIIGAQNVSSEKEGAFTGEISALMVKEAGCSFVLLGHSERRALFHETNEKIRLKLQRCLSDDLIPVLCIGETLEEHEGNRRDQVLEEQLAGALEGLSEKDVAPLVIAYEPVWAIGTGKSATPKLIESAHAFCRRLLIDLFGKKRGDLIPILYGGSVKPSNAKEIAQEREIHGFLVGGASLDPEAFAEILLTM